ncbi:hypothetical protein [Zhongshania sp. BJYM1]|jgi:hypothetical protein|uniref:hypothetical protein n=1 Tax=Zhongshania aquatica TaxID=2965069 RepID=UPI0022B57145|nr:hypothetical protein [Marortus sp. BJYM1]
MHQRSTLFTVFLTALTLSLCACSKSTDVAGTPNQEKTVLTSGQQNTLNQAQLMEKTLQDDVEIREQKMRDEGI